MSNTRQRTIGVAALLVVALFGGACASTGTDAELEAALDALEEAEAELEATRATTTQAPTTTPSSTTAAPADTATPATTTASTTTVATATTDAPATTESVDETPPTPPTNMACGGAGGSGEFSLSWEAPPDVTDITGVKVYLSESGGPFNRIHKFPLDAGAVGTTGPRWDVVAYPMPGGVPIELAVTHYDAAGNESGWYPIDAYYAGAGGNCWSGAPDAPVIQSVDGSAGSGEASLVITPPAPDVVSYRVWADSGDGMTELTILYMQDAPSSPGDVMVDTYPTEWSMATTFRVVAVDAHGHESTPTDRSCPENWGWSVVC